MPMILVPLESGKPIAINKAILFFGRSSDCDIVLSQSRKVSRKHCCLAQIENSYFVRDLGSMNGIRVNEEKADPELPIKGGDELWVGDVGFRLQPATSAVIPAHDYNSESDFDSLDSSDEPEPPKVPQKPAPGKAKPIKSDLPVALPEEDGSFKVEESMPNKIIDSDETDSR